MTKVYTSFWVASKRTPFGVEHRDRRPKVRHVVENTKRIRSQWGPDSRVEHTLAGPDGQLEVFVSHCGYDRGPKLYAKIKRMLEGKESNQ